VFKYYEIKQAIPLHIRWKPTNTKRELFDYSINPPYSSHSSTTDPMQCSQWRCQQIHHKNV